VSTAEGDALAWLYSLADQERGVGWNPRASPESQWKLGRTRALLELVGAPDRDLRVVLVAGTKGKGSSCAMLASVLDAGGVRVGLYTKPHLQSYRERIRVGGVAITPDAFAQAVRRMRRTVGKLETKHAEAGEPTTFEVTTALAIDEFARAGCAVAVVEVGLGGRLDATNALEPELSVITSISHDHTAVLGRSLAAIAREKAGILRPGRPALLALQRPTAERALRAACRAIGADCRPIAPLRDGVRLHGEHQRQNAALAVAAARMLAQPEEAEIRSGLQRLRWPGRFEVIDGDPVMVLDGAHNDASADVLAQTLTDFAAGRSIQLILGINRDKDARAILRPLLPLARRVWATQVTDSVRAMPLAELAARCRRQGAQVEKAETVADALGEARARARGGVVCVTGSLALVGQARDALGLPVPERLW
jgi:dihydrofolate synthase / folylpolyglutamate synthase